MRRSRIVQILNVSQGVRLGSSLAAALLDGLFVPSAGRFPNAQDVLAIDVTPDHDGISSAC
jgi:hypothetical protein